MANVTHIYGNEVTDAAARGSLAPEYSASSTYAVGDLVLHDGQLYECNTTISTAEAWTAAHWTAKTVADEVTDLKDGLTKIPDLQNSAKTGVDLDGADPSGNVLYRFANGHIQTKNFDSSKVGTIIRESSATGVDIDGADKLGNVLYRFKDGHIQTKNFSSVKINPHIITLKADGTGNFNTLRAAVDSITDANPETNPYEIHVYPGVYNTLEGYTDAEIRAADIGGGYTDQSMVGIKLTDGISLIGIGDPSTVILTAELDTTDYTSAVRGNISTLNLKGTCRIENLTIKAKNLRYCVHDDFEFSKRYTRIVRNCIFVPIGMVMSYNPATSYGSGIRIAGVDALFENCDFGYAFGMHTKTGMTGCSTVVFNHCTGLCMRLGDTAAENDTAHHTYIVNDCNFGSIRITRPTATTPHIFVIGVGNNNTMLFSPSADHPHVANILKTKLSSVPVGTFVNVNADSMTSTSGGITAEVASDIYSAIGIIVDKDDYYDYIQTDGYIQGSRLGLSNLSVGDFVTVDNNMKLASGGTSSNWVGVVKYTDSNDNSQIMLRR